MLHNSRGPIHLRVRGLDPGCQGHPQCVALHTGAHGKGMVGGGRYCLCWEIANCFQKWILAIPLPASLCS